MVFSFTDGTTSSSPSRESSDSVQNDPEPDVSEGCLIIKALSDLNLSNYTGAKYLVEAIVKPDSQINFTNLRNLFNHHSGFELVDEEIGEQVPLFQFNYSISPDYETPATILDEQAVKDYKKRLIKITQCIAERQAFQDDAWIDDLIEERDFIVAELMKAHTRFGKLRTFVTQNRRDRQACTKAIKELVERLRKLDPKLGEICDRHVILKTYLAWSGEPIDK